MSLPGAGELSGMGGRLTFLFGLLLAVSALTGWYSGDGNGTTVSVIGWHTGTIGKIVLFLDLAAIVLVVVREAGVSMPASVPSLVLDRHRLDRHDPRLVRIVSIPDSFFFASRGIGIWISLACASGSSSPAAQHPTSCSQGSGDRHGHRAGRRVLWKGVSVLIVSGPVGSAARRASARMRLEQNTSTAPITISAARTTGRRRLARAWPVSRLGRSSIVTVRSPLPHARRRGRPRPRPTPACGAIPERPVPKARRAPSHRRSSTQ
jgi:hypothetical protein